MLQALRGGERHPLPRRHRPGDRDLGHRRVACERSAHVARTLHDVEGARWETGVDEDLGQSQRAQRCELRRLEHHRVAGCQRRRRLPAGDLDRIVPRTDRGAHAERLAARVGERRAEVDVLAGVRRDQTGEVLQAVGARRGIGDKRLLQRLAGVERFEHRQLVVAFTDRLGGSVQHTPTLDGRRLRPGREPAAGGVHRLFDHGRIGGAQAGDDRPVARVDALELGPVTIDELPVDEMTTRG